MNKLSIVILNYNTKDLLKNCLDSLKKIKDEVDFKITVIDNGSTDGSAEMVESKFPSVKVIKNKSNLGFAKGNNAAKNSVSGKYVLFLNSDTEVRPDVLKETVNFLDKNPDVGAMTCKIELPDGTLDKDARRSFPTPWVSFTHFSHLDRIFPTSPFFARYWVGYKDANKVQEVESLQGAFFLTRKKILDSVGWFDEEYFLDGEDIDLSWKIKEVGYKIFYYPKVSILHIKGATKGKNKILEAKPGLLEKKKYVLAGVDSMEIFYKKRLWENYPLILNFLAILGIFIMRIFRYTRLHTQ